MEDGRLTGARAGIQNMLFYYLTALVDNGVQDPKQYIATEIGKMIDLSEEQVMYVKGNMALSNKMLESLSSSIDLLVNMEKAQKIDIESLNISIGLLKEIQKSCLNVLEVHNDR